MTDHLEPPDTVADMTQPPRELAELCKKVDRQGKEIARCGEELEKLKDRVEVIGDVLERRNERF